MSYCTNLLEWEKGRQLKKLTKPDGKTITYTYNANGIRTGKTVGTSKHTYILDGTKILSESHGAITTYVHYDNEGSVCGITYNSTPYYFLRNLQGDVIAITDENGEVVARYRYDAWGKVLSVTDQDGAPITSPNNIANINPYRYRGYYYDRETGLYYLQSRYYDPETGRFINADEATYVQSVEKAIYHCLYTYCENDSINKTDLTGCATSRVVGYGFQIELNIGFLTIGVEFIWYIVSSIRKGRAWYIPYTYYYGGLGITADLTSMIAKITKNPALLFNPKKITKADASISIFAIWGYAGKFTKPEHYEGPFSGASVTVWNAKAYTAWSDTCFVVGAGISTSKFSFSSGVTVYLLSSKVYGEMKKLYDSVSKKGKTLKQK